MRALVVEAICSVRYLEPAGVLGGGGRRGREGGEKKLFTAALHGSSPVDEVMAFGSPAASSGSMGFSSGGVDGGLLPRQSKERQISEIDFMFFVYLLWRQIAAVGCDILNQKKLTLLGRD